MRGGRFTWRGLALAGWAALAPLLPAAEATNTAVEASAPESLASQQAWTELEAALAALPPTILPEWQTNRPSPQAFAEYRLGLSEKVAAVAQKAREFYQKFPEAANASTARLREEQLLRDAAQMGATNVLERLKELDAARAEAPDPIQRFNYKAQAIRRQWAQALKGEGNAEAMAACVKDTRALQTEFPARIEPWEMLLDQARQMEVTPAKNLAREIEQNCPFEDIQRQAQLWGRTLDLPGKTLALKFTALDKREVDLAQWRGKAVLVVFWATWCGPYVAGLNDDLALYEKWHPKGLEIAGICLDKKVDAAQAFIQDRQIPWAQQCDGQAWLNPLAAQYGIRHLPTYWLIDKTGVVRDLRAEKNLEASLEKLLAESP